jgi:hypothetical protein
MADACVDGVVIVLKNVETGKECEEKECWCCVRWKQELNNVVIELNSVKEIVKILKEELDIVEMEVRSNVDTIQSKNNVSDYSEKNWLRGQPPKRVHIKNKIQLGQWLGSSGSN